MTTIILYENLNKRHNEQNFLFSNEDDQAQTVSATFSSLLWQTSVIRAISAKAIPPA